MNKKIQVLRGIAIIAVVMIHTYPLNEIGIVIRPFVNFAVAMFFFLSRYLTKIDIGNYGKFCKKRILRVLIPYFIWSVVFCVASGKYSTFLTDILTAKCNGTYYFIFVYIQFVLITPLVIKLAKSKFRFWGLTVSPLSIFSAYYLSRLMNISFYSPIPLFFVHFNYYYLGILLGNELAEYKINYKKSFIIYVLSIVMQIAEGFIWYYAFDNYNMATAQLKLTAIFTSSMALLIGYKYLKANRFNASNFLSKILVKSGDYSFGIYLSHYLIIGIINDIPGYNYLVFPLNSLTVVFVAALCVFVGKKILGNYSKYLGL